jgi:hypothetical protein
VVCILCGSLRLDEEMIFFCVIPDDVVPFEAGL